MNSFASGGQIVGLKFDSLAPNLVLLKGFNRKEGMFLSIVALVFMGMQLTNF
jgi:hypothetical protein